MAGRLIAQALVLHLELAALFVRRRDRLLHLAVFLFDFQRLRGAAPDRRQVLTTAVQGIAGSAQRFGFIPQAAVFVFQDDDALFKLAHALARDGLIHQIARQDPADRTLRGFNLGVTLVIGF